jgi:hypothetical protein
MAGSPPFKRRDGGSSPPGGTMRASLSLCSSTGQSARLLNANMRVRVSPEARPVGVAAISPGSQPGDRRFDPGTGYSTLRPRRLWVGSGTFTSRDRVRVPVGVLRGSQVRKGTGLISRLCTGSNPVPATKSTIRCRLKAGPVAVTHVTEVRLLPPERVTEVLRASWSGRRPVKAEIAGSSPVGTTKLVIARTAWLACGLRSSDGFRAAWSVPAGHGIRKTGTILSGPVILICAMRAGCSR